MAESSRWVRSRVTESARKAGLERLAAGGPRLGRTRHYPRLHFRGLGRLGGLVGQLLHRHARCSLIVSSDGRKLSSESVRNGSTPCPSHYPMRGSCPTRFFRHCDCGPFAAASWATPRSRWRNCLDSPVRRSRGGGPHTPRTAWRPSPGNVPAARSAPVAPSTMARRRGSGRSSTRKPLRTWELPRRCGPAGPSPT